MQPSFLHIIVVVILLVLLFGRGKISDLMGDVAAGIKNFKKGMSEDERDEDVVVQKRVTSASAKPRAAKPKKPKKSVS